MLPHANDKMLRDWTFQHGNNPKHTSKLVTEFLAQKKVRFLEWASQSPDLNPIEHLWEHIERKISVRKPSNQHDLFELIKRTWEEMKGSVEKVLKLHFFKNELRPVYYLITSPKPSL